MSTSFLVPETTVREQGKAEAIRFESGGAALITLGILAVKEQQSLLLSVWHSLDGADWGAKPLVQFSQKFYVGTHQLVANTQAGYLQARWHVNRWGRGDLTPCFRFYVAIEPLP